MDSEHKPTSKKPCDHDSTRVDGMLDDHCMKCGEDGYWHEGTQHDKIHPSGKLLFSLEGLSS